MDERLRNVHRCIQAGRLLEAESRLRTLAAAEPENATYGYLRGVVARADGRLEDAIRHLEGALAKRPDDPPILKLLAGCHQRSGDAGRAAALYESVLARTPEDGEALAALGDFVANDGDMAAAARLYRRAQEAGDETLALRRRFGMALLRIGQAAEAAAQLEPVVDAAPEDLNALMALAEALSASGSHGLALQLMTRAMTLAPDRGEVWNNMALVLGDLGRLDEVEAHLRAGIRRHPDDAGLRTKYGMLHQREGRIEAALQEYAEGRRLDPTGLAARGYLFAMHNLSRFAPEEIAGAHRSWGRAFQASVVGPAIADSRERDPEKPLTVGYVSGDLRRHSVAYFLEPILANHDRTVFASVVLSMTRDVDATTARLRRLCPDWRSLVGLGDDVGAKLVRDLGIDILVDLSGHTVGSRLGIFARRAAPVQVTYLGYPNTTGLPTIDYRLTDAVADPSAADDALHTEALVRLPGCFLCYRPDDDAPDVAPPPADSAGTVTFGSFNNIAKVSDDALSAWSRILDRVAHGRLLIKARGLEEGRTSEGLALRLEAAGIARDRVDLLPAVRTAREHLAAYGRIDVALDTFPYNGTATTCEALWMGVPIVALRGRSHVGRVGAALLHACGLDRLIAESADEYVSTAVALAEAAGRRRALRAGLRERLRRSELLDGPGFTRGLEATYRSMWRTACRADAAAAQT